VRDNKFKQSSTISNFTFSSQKVAITESVFNEEPIFDMSECAINPKEKAFFKEIIGSKQFRTVIRYKGSRDGWMRADFHRMSDGMGPTVSLFKIKENNQCVGGFTSAEWSSIFENVIYVDTTAMIFNLTTRN